MKRFKLSTIVLSTCLAMSALAGCSQGSAPAAGTIPDRAKPHEIEGVASEISANIYDAEDPEDAAAEAPADEDSFSGNYTDSVDGEYADTLTLLYLLLLNKTFPRWIQKTLLSKNTWILFASI